MAGSWLAPAGRLRRAVQLLLWHQDRRKGRRPVYDIQFTNHQDDGGKDYRQHYVYQIPVVVVHCARTETSDRFSQNRTLIRRIKLRAVAQLHFVPLTGVKYLKEVEAGLI